MKAFENVLNIVSNGMCIYITSAGFFGCFTKISENVIFANQIFFQLFFFFFWIEQKKAFFFSSFIELIYSSIAIFADNNTYVAFWLKWQQQKTSGFQKKLWKGERRERHWISIFHINISWYKECTTAKRTFNPRETKTYLKDSRVDKMCWIIFDWPKKFFIWVEYMAFAYLWWKRTFYYWLCIVYKVGTCKINNKKIHFCRLSTVIGFLFFHIATIDACFDAANFFFYYILFTHIINIIIFSVWCDADCSDNKFLRFNILEHTVKETEL